MTFFEDCLEAALPSLSAHDGSAWSAARASPFGLMLEDAAGSAG